ncbi:hypothetical protein LUZ62_084406 [Rhynchospora pubera]|uniref:KIB1-4 beta-propeller domain-containing protein n=1 Tax=Rhynchospora pubera TaxID=906938 RepID=A0AAV8C3C5_9POAL|nr:hypothetical protein LUZ62_084406 [Rhynchospora pubera]
MENFTKHTPFLLTACNHHGKENSDFTLYSISDKLHFKFDEPFLHEKVFIGSQHGWLIVLDQHFEPTLVNPLTGESISLPSITTLQTGRPCYSINSNIVSYFCRMEYPPESPFLNSPFDECLTQVGFRKVLVSSNPSISSSSFFAAALIGTLFPTLVVARPGENRWNLLREEEWYMDMMFRQDGKLLCLTNEGAIHEVELKNDKIVITEMAGPFHEDKSAFNMYLAEDCVGRVLAVKRDNDFSTKPETCDVKVFRFIGSNREESQWERVKSLDEEAIFVGANASITLAKQDIRGEIKPNTIYFTDEWWQFIGSERSKRRPRDICSYNLTSNSIKPCCPYKHRRCTWPLPIWIDLPNPNLILN